MIQKRTQLSVFAVAALAIVAVAAVMLLAGGNPAQATATTATLAPDGGGGHLLPQQADPTPTPQTVPEPCSANPVAVVDSGHYAVFDIYWDAEDKNLVNNPCPPKAKHTTTTRKVGQKTVKETTTTRTASNIDVRQTIFHVTEEAKETVTASGSGPFDGATYEVLRPLIDAESERRAESAEVWILPSDDSNLLIIGASAGLLQKDDWASLDWEFESIREPGVEPGDRGRIFVFPDTDDDPDDPGEPLWDTQDPDDNAIDVGPGEYKHFNWAFTMPGTYVLQVHVKAHPDLEVDDSQFKGGNQKAATSVVTRYTFHVGLMADLSVEGTANPTTPTPGGNVTFKFTARNSGPDKATNTKVQVHLPKGLTYQSEKASTGSYDSNTGIWDVGDLTSGSEATISVTATVAEGTRGKPQMATAHIFATEAIGSSTTVVELDPREGNNTASVTVVPPRSDNDNPLFQVSRSVTENVLAGTNVGGPIKVREPNAGDTLSFTLEGHGASDFTATSATGGVQIKVSDTGFVDYEVKTSYDLVLGVSDGKDADGNADPSIDDRIAVQIDVTDVVGDPSLQLRPDKLAPRMGERVTLRVTPHDLPQDHGTLTYHWTDIYPDGTSRVLSNHHGDTLARTVSEPDPSTYTYFATLEFKDNGETRRIKSNVLRVTWSGS